jgi:hypothetical protein
MARHGKAQRHTWEMVKEQVTKKRFKVDENGCYLWQGTINNSTGYGIVSVMGRLYGVHRLAWQFANGPIPEGMVVCHKCDVCACCNPDHLFIGTLRDNALDMCAKGRNARGEDGGGARYTWKQVDDIRRRALNGESMRGISRQLSIPFSTI